MRLPGRGGDPTAKITFLIIFFPIFSRSKAWSAAVTRCPSGSVVSMLSIVTGDHLFEYHSRHFFAVF